MNEQRIEELKALATEIEHSHGAFGEYEQHHRLNADKLIELVVRECIGIVKQRWIDPNEDVIAEEIKEHFGVEE